MEYFKEEDIKRWEVKEKSVLGLEQKQIFTGIDIELPFSTFYNLIGRRRPEYIKYLPLELEEVLKYLPLELEEVFNLPKTKIEFLWFLLKEFRFQIQKLDPIVNTLIAIGLDSDLDADLFACEMLEIIYPFS